MIDVGTVFFFGCRQLPEIFNSMKVIVNMLKCLCIFFFLMVAACMLSMIYSLCLCTFIMMAYVPLTTGGGQ